MKQSNDDLIKKFERLTRWMIEDCERSIYKAKANFLVAQGLLNYTEIIGSFMTPKSLSGENFDAFFAFMGSEYANLLSTFNNKRSKNPHIVYDDLRCGLTHEYTIKRKKFTVYGADTAVPILDSEVHKLKINVGNREIECRAGVLHTWNDSKKKLGTWHIITPVYLSDFRKAVERYIDIIKDTKKRDARKKFFQQARKINLIHFN
ncbi:MAG TPA: hypothetical protein PLT50_01490 [bacterium]|nr:hypothetical protein [bacterium]